MSVKKIKVENSRKTGIIFGKRAKEIGKKKDRNSYKREWWKSVEEEMKKDKKIILWEVNSFPAIEIKSREEEREDV